MVVLLPTFVFAMPSGRQETPSGSCLGIAPSDYDLAFVAAGALVNIDPCLLKAQALTENSTLDPYARSSRGAVGCAQFMEATWDELMDEYNLHWQRIDCVASIFAQALYLNKHLQFFLDEGLEREEALKYALAAYNRGRWGLLEDIGRGAVGMAWNAVKNSTAGETVGYVGKTIRRLMLWRRR